MAQKNDSVFQLSLTEIAFTIAFLLLLLLGYLVVKEQTEREAAQAALAQVQTAERATEALNTAKSELTKQLQDGGKPNPDEVISRLVAAEQLRAERDQLRRKVEDLDAKLTALTELKQQIAKAAASKQADVTKDEVIAALALQEQVREAVREQSQTPSKGPATKASGPSEGSAASSHSPASSRPAAGATAAAAGKSEVDARSVSHQDAAAAVRQALAATSELKRQLSEKLGRQLQAGKEAETVQDVVSAAKGYADLAKPGQNPDTIKKENSDLRGQVAFLKNRLDARGGRDYPPCWADESGKVEFLFAIEVRPDSVSVSPAWPARREAAARALPDIETLLAGPHSNQTFISKVQGVFTWSKAQDPECRHYVQLKSSIQDAVQSDRARLMVEGFFYKVEARR